MGTARRERVREWIVTQAESKAVEAALERWGVERGALIEGRVFVDRKRASLGMVLVPGARVEVYPASDTQGAAAVRVIERRGGVAAVYKPAGIPTIPDHRGSEGSVTAVVAKLLGMRDASAVHTSSRLDTEVSGVLLVATTESGRRKLSQAREAGRYRRHYVALTQGSPAPPEGIVDAPIGRARDRRFRSVGGAEAVAAQTRYSTIARSDAFAMIAAEPITGRTHQIRVHMAHVSAPLLGDTAYGRRRTVVDSGGAVIDPGRIALHAAWVEVGLEPGGQLWTVQAEVPAQMRDLWARLGGLSDDWDQALRAL